MSPKEKAKDLIEKFRPQCYCFLGSGMLTNTYHEGVSTMNAKQCALIAVDEIWIALNLEHGHGDIYNFWSNVKFELEKL